MGQEGLRELLERQTTILVAIVSSYKKHALIHCNAQIESLEATIQFLWAYWAKMTLIEKVESIVQIEVLFLRQLDFWVLQVWLETTLLFQRMN